jgi:hypothetical protein
MTRLKLVSKEDYVSMPVPQNYWPRFDSRISIMLWEGIALYCGIDPEVIKRKGHVTKKTRQYKTGDILVFDETVTCLHPKLYAAYKERLAIASECLLFSEGLTSPSPQVNGVRRKVKIENLVQFIKGQGWPETEGLGKLIALPASPSSSSEGSTNHIHKKLTHWTDLDKIVVRQKVEKAKRDGIRAFNRTVADEYGVSITLIKNIVIEAAEILKKPPTMASQLLSR